MSSAEPKDGDRVEVSYEGKYESAFSANCIKVRDDAGRAHFYYPGSNVAISVVEPEYISGEVYVDAKGMKYLRMPGKVLQWRPLGFSSFGHLPDVGHDYPKRPLTRLVPENG